MDKILDPKKSCRLGQGEKCCAFLVLGAYGFECGKADEAILIAINTRLLLGTMVAQGRGDWKECLYGK